MADSFETGELDQLEAQRSGSRTPIFFLLLRYYWLLILGGVVGCVVGMLYYSRATPVYQSSAQILIVKKNQEPLPTGSSELGEGSRQEDYIATHTSIIRSPLIVANAVQQAQLGNLPSFAGDGDPVGTIIGGLKISRQMNDGKSTSVLNISYRCSNSQDTAAVLAAIIESYQRFLKDRYKNVADEALKLIAQANEILEGKLNKKQEEYDAFLAQQPPGLWKSKDGLNSIQVQLMNLESKKSSLQLQEAELEGRLTALQQALETGRYSRAELLAMIAQGLGSKSGKDTSTLSIEERLMTLELQEKTLLEDYGPDHPQVRSVRDQLAMLRRWMNRSVKDATDEAAGVDPVKTHIQTLKLELENTQKAIHEVGKLLQEAYKKAEPLHLFEKRDESYRTEIARSQQLFNAVAKRLDEVSILKNFSGGYEAEAITPPQPGAKVAPRATVVVSTAVLLGLFLGFGLAYLAELTDQRFRSPEEIRRQLGLPVVGHIPFFARSEEEPPVDGLPVDPVLCTAHRPKSREAEAYRGVRTALLFSRQGGHTVIQVTSPDMGDGKSTLIANLAISIAQAEKKVILIDADFRRPRVHKLFNLSAKQGLASVMSGEAELNDVTLETPIPGLSILPCGPIPPNPAELLTLPRFKELLAYLREKYDYVLIDTPPLLAVTDPCVVVPYVDGVILTVRISKNVRPHALRAKEILSTLGARVIGVVVNGVGTDAKGYGYGYGYGGYRYGYGYGYGYYYNYGNYEGDASAAEEGKENNAADETSGKSKGEKTFAHRSSEKKSGLLTWLFDR